MVKSIGDHNNSEESIEFLVEQATSLTVSDLSIDLQLDFNLVTMSCKTNAIAKIITKKNYSANVVCSILSRAWNLHQSWFIGTPMCYGKKSLLLPLNTKRTKKELGTGNLGPSMELIW